MECIARDNLQITWQGGTQWKQPRTKVLGMLRDEFIDSIRVQSANSGEFCCRAAAPEKYPQREFSSKIEVCLAEKVVPRKKKWPWMNCLGSEAPVLVKRWQKSCWKFLPRAQRVGGMSFEKRLLGELGKSTFWGCRGLFLVDNSTFNPLTYRNLKYYGVWKVIQ